MLTQLTIHHFVLIDQLDLDLKQGLTVLTGETGAGKSIMIDAIALTLGARAQSGVVRKGADRCQLSLRFNLSQNAPALAWLKARELDDGDQCIIRRTIYQDGKSKSQINGQATSLTEVRALGDFLVNICGQHQQQLLLKKDVQRQSLDQFGQLDALVDTVRADYQRWQTAQANLNTLTAQTANHADRVQLLRYQVAELEDANLDENEFAQCEGQHKNLSQAEHILTASQHVLSLLSDTDATANLSVNTALHQSLRELTPLADVAPNLKNSVECLQQALIQTDEASTNLNQFIDQVDLSQEKLQQTEQRLNQYHTLARKHQVEPEKLYAHGEELKKTLADIKGIDASIDQLADEVKANLNRYQKNAKKLSTQRAQAAKTLAADISKQMQILGMPGGRLQIEFNALANPSQNGLEQVQVLVSTNPGEPLQPLDKVISGGELSRISLAIAAITAQQANTPMLIFDEVDVGIGGATAEVVGKLLQQLSHNAQVLCITHLAQVAALGDQHLCVTKTTTKNQTQTHIQVLNEEQTTHEIARMLGGMKVTEQTLKTAQEMLS